MPQDISSEDEDQHLVDALTTRNHVLDNPDATELDKTVKETIRQAKIEEGSLPNPRYMNLTAAQERQLELDELLWFAAEHGELDLARQALHDGANVSSNDADFYNQTALHCASQFLAGHPAMVELLVEHGADVNARSCHNNTAMHEAAYWGYGPTVAKLLQLGADPFALNHLNNTPLLNAEGNWQGVPRPCVGLLDMKNASMLLWEHPTNAGWRHRLRPPEQRKVTVDLLIAAMGNRSYGRGDIYCGGLTFPDLWRDWDEEGEHYNPLSRPREFKNSVPPFRSPFQEEPASRKKEWVFAGEKEIDADLDRIWHRDKWQYYEMFPDDSASDDDEQQEQGSDEDSVDSGKDQGELLTHFDAGGPDAALENEFDMPNDGGLGGPELDDDGADAEGAVANQSSE